MMRYTTSDAIKDLRPILDRAPPEAVSGEWVATTTQAGVSSQSGTYRDLKGAAVDAAPHKIIRDVVEKLENSQTRPFNKIIVRWTKKKMPFLRGRVTVETIFDPAIVPRGPDSPVYEAAAVARLNFWRARGDLADGFAADRGEVNIYNQTKWFGPHHRVIAVRSGSTLTLATDGLSTPWAGIVDQQNGVECELFMEFDVTTMDDKKIDNWAHLLIGIGDLVADGYGVARDVEKYGAILFCRLADEYNPMSRIILSRDAAQIEGLPFGSVPLIRVTPITEVEIEGQDQSDEWAANAAKYALAKRQIGI
ncbi:hypothetical protein [Rhizobium lusitanum]|uniref:hypothetical protein n=1 Tax=Rhizobium lusitanum TaxID=293958 RepID=UPI0015718AE7|nr:hypothetical protein [Rhizobium lusitanum]NTJ09295.1 hypothetical protein [Rhizobium lusitanum]